MDKGEKLKVFREIVEEISKHIDNFSIEVSSYSESGVADEIIVSSFNTNIGFIQLIEKLDRRISKEPYSIRLGDKIASLPKTNVVGVCDDLIRMFEDISSDLRSLFHERNPDDDGPPEFDDMDGEI